MHRETATLITAWLRERNGHPGDSGLPDSLWRLHSAEMLSSEW